MLFILLSSAFGYRQYGWSGVQIQFCLKTFPLTPFSFLLLAFLYVYVLSAAAEALFELEIELSYLSSLH
jgi:hypothetical protein